jgi:hypothetical protein
MIKSYLIGGDPVTIDTNLTGRNLLDRIRRLHPAALVKSQKRHRHWGFMGHLIDWYPTKKEGKHSEHITLFAFDMKTGALVPLPGGESLVNYKAATKFISDKMKQAWPVT